MSAVVALIALAVWITLRAALRDTGRFRTPLRDWQPGELAALGRES